MLDYIVYNDMISYENCRDVQMGLSAKPTYIPQKNLVAILKHTTRNVLLTDFGNDKDNVFTKLNGK